MARQQYLSVEATMQEGDRRRLQELGRLGGINCHRARKTREALAERLAALERGSILPPPKARQPRRKPATITWRRLQTLKAWVANPANYEDECYARDMQAQLHICPVD